MVDCGCNTVFGAVLSGLHKISAMSWEWSKCIEIIVEIICSTGSALLQVLPLEIMLFFFVLQISNVFV